MEVLTRKVVKEKKRTGRPPKNTPEFYMMMAKRISEEKMSIREAARIYKVSHGSIHYWLKMHKNGKMPAKIKKAKSDVATQSSRINYLESYVNTLKAEIGELYLENQMLKKAQKWLEQQKNVISSAITSENLDQWRGDAK